VAIKMKKEMVILIIVIILVSLPVGYSIGYIVASEFKGDCGCTLEIINGTSYYYGK